LECPELCSLKEGSKWGKQASDMLVAGASLRTVIAAAAKDNIVLHTGTLSRHKKHIVMSADDSGDAQSAEKATNIEILETIIQKGFANRKNWKPTISDTMKAMDMWFRLTAGNPFDELLNTLAAASVGDENPDTEGGPTGIEAPEVEDDDTGG
jgi:hypothetical protein